MRVSVQLKAKEIIEDFLQYSNRPSMVEEFSIVQKSIQILNAKECARILVKQILKNEVQFSNFLALTNNLVISKIYWENVLVEIDNYPNF